MAEAETGDERHTVCKVQTHDSKIEYRVNGDGVDEHEETFKESAHGNEADSACGGFVCGELAEEA